MADLVERLRATPEAMPAGTYEIVSSDGRDPLRLEAADEIERLRDAARDANREIAQLRDDTVTLTRARDEIERLRKALETISEMDWAEWADAPDVASKALKGDDDS